MVVRKSLLAVAVAMGTFVFTNAGVHAHDSWPPLFTVLDGGNEVSASGAANAGDKNGRGSFTAIIQGNQLCYGLTVTAIATPTAAHIHVGAAGVNGPIVAVLETPDGGDPGTSSGCVTIADPALLNNIRANSTNYYINVHNAAFPAGAVRGQLF